MTDSPPRFNIGDIVLLDADPSRKGSIVEILPAVQGQSRYRVFHSASDIREYLEGQISPVSAPDGVGLADAGLSPEEFLARLNALRLSYPQVDSLYALHAARIQFIPFQFKPLLRFLRSDRQRLLIADEVGVGKTIEAGLILRELQSRQTLNNILILCPKSLVLKWKAEMRRFDEDFSVLTSETLRYCLKETHLDGVWPVRYARAITHLELLRREEHLYGTGGRWSRPGLLTLRPPPQFDLLIVDEAHHLRNPENNTHEMAQFLCGVSGAVLFLTATPLQLGSENLFTLLNLLRPDQFIDHSIFGDMIVPNRYLNQAIRAVRTKMPASGWQPVASSALDKAARTSWGEIVLSQDPKFADATKRLKTKTDISDQERIELITDLEEVHTLAHVMNRTRRRDIGRFTIREPFAVRVEFTEPQRAIYESIITYRQDVLAQEYPPLIVSLITGTLERQAASCLPALIPLLDGFIRTGRFIASDASDDTEWELSQELPAHLRAKSAQLRRMAESLPKQDPKFDALVKIVSQTVSSSGPGKVLVFSFFLHTLSYLDAGLREAGYRVGVVNGRIPDEEREMLRARFRLAREQPDALDVLLSSEVGCEGLDYEFCDRLVNYDIPWNPMRIEQRIGRIDRFGQQSEKVQIYNFITPGTIEERVFFRCFERLGIFRDTVGDMEEVLGELTEQLTQAALDPSLRPRQVEEKAMQLADNLLRKVEEQRRLEEESTELLGLDQAFNEEINDIRRHERFVSPDEIRQMIDLYLGHRCQNARVLGEGKGNKLVKVRASREDRNTLLNDLRALKRQDRQTSELQRWLEGNDPHLTVTFDQETALQHRDIPFVTPVHPLAKMAMSYWRAREGPLFAHMQVADSQAEPGTYVFVLHLWETVSLRSSLRLIPAVWDLKGQRLAEEVSVELPRLIRMAGRIPAPLSMTEHQIEEVLHCLEEHIYEKRSSEADNLRSENHQLVERTLASLDQYFRQRLEGVERDLASATDERIRRMKMSEKDRIEREWQHKQQEIEKGRQADIVSQRVAYGILEVIAHAKRL